MNLESAIRLSCLWEAAARKPGNVHPGAAFADLRHRDFVVSAEVAAPVLARTRGLGVGGAVLEAVTRTREAVGRNTNLGIVLLLAPLAAVEPHRRLADGIGAVLERLTREDASRVYQAIRLAQPGGMGMAPQQDLSVEPTGTLLEVMCLAAGRDAVALQYATRFELVLGFGVRRLASLGGANPLAEQMDQAVGQAASLPTEAGSFDHGAASLLFEAGSFGHVAPPAAWEEAVIGLHLELMARQPDTLIARKCGQEVADRSAALARDVLESGWPHTPAGRDKLRQLDGWLRADGNRRNPGTTADLVAACLFAALRDSPAHHDPFSVEDSP